MKNIVKRKSTLSPDEYHPFSLFWANNGFLARFPLFGKTQKRLFLRNSGRDRVRCQCGKVLFSVQNQFASSSRLYPLPLSQWVRERCKKNSNKKLTSVSFMYVCEGRKWPYVSLAGKSVFFTLHPYGLYTHITHLFLAQTDPTQWDNNIPISKMRPFV